jgi:transposase InsO family protein
MTQVARNVTDINEDFLCGKRYLLLDRDTKYTDAFRSVLVREGVQVIRLPPRSPNMNAFAERFVRSIKEVCCKAIPPAPQFRAEGGDRHSGTVAGCSRRGRWRRELPQG